MCRPILGDPGADFGGEGKFKRAETSLSHTICPWVSDDGAAG